MSQRESLTANQMWSINDSFPFPLLRYILATPDATTFPRLEDFFKCEPLPESNLLKLGANKQKALKFHEILAKLLFIKAYRRFSTSQILADFKGRFLRAYNPMESTIFSSEKSYSPCKLKWLHRMTESFRMASISSFLRSSLLSLPSSFAR